MNLLFLHVHRILMMLTVLFEWHGSIVLELVEGPLQHVLRVDLLHSQQVQHHIVGKMKCRVERIWLTLQE